MSAPKANRRTLGRYEVHDRLAVGGMASVHLGRLAGVAGFTRIVALKRLHDHFARDKKFVAMLLDEARLVALLRHPNVVATLEVVADGDSLAIVMEYVEGEPVDGLSEALAARGGRVPLGMAVSIAVQVLQGLHAAHELVDSAGNKLDIVHRDVSPQNIIVGVDGVARILDFGVARASVRLQGTETGELKGKLAYMSPEQLGEGAIDRRTDIFAVGVMLWELLTGNRLFLGPSPVATVTNILNKTIPPASRLGQGSRTLDAVVLRALERDPARRFETAEQFAMALEETVRIPKPREVGRWVAEVAAEPLAKRAAVVRRIATAPPLATREGVPSSPDLARMLASVGQPLGVEAVLSDDDAPAASADGALALRPLVPTLVDAPSARAAALPEFLSLTEATPAGATPRTDPFAAEGGAPDSVREVMALSSRSTSSSVSLSAYVPPGHRTYGRLRLASFALLALALVTFGASAFSYVSRSSAPSPQTSASTEPAAPVGKTLTSVAAEPSVPSIVAIDAAPSGVPDSGLAPKAKLPPPLHHHSDRHGD